MVTDEEIEKAAELLRKGRLVAFPTETVYGLGADASNTAAVKRLFAAKGRPAAHPVIVHIADANQLKYWAAELPRHAWLLAEKFWPGPLTMILKRAPTVSDLVTGGQDSVGLRVPNHPVALRLLRAFGGGIAAPSANRFGRLSPTTADHVRQEMGDAVDMILDAGACEVGIESTIVDLTRERPMILRPGHISERQIAETLFPPPIDVATHDGHYSELQFDNEPRSDRPRVSGSLASHYAPLTPTRILVPELIEEFVRRKAGGPVAVLARRGRPQDSRAALWQVAPDNAPEYARMLYSLLRRLDASGCRMIVIEDLPELPEWVAVKDRISRAATPEPVRDMV
jgi:L-threonylcarbamoyladenylate synthase